MPSELKTCPFCNSEATTLEYYAQGGKLWCVGCKDSKCIAFRCGFADTEENAIAKWNRRVTDCTNCPDRNFASKWR